MYVLDGLNKCCYMAFSSGLVTPRKLSVSEFEELSRSLQPLVDEAGLATTLCDRELDGLNKHGRSAIKADHG
jgi:hypothetical protein